MRKVTLTAIALSLLLWGAAYPEFHEAALDFGEVIAQTLRDKA